MTLYLKRWVETNINDPVSGEMGGGRHKPKYPLTVNHDLIDAFPVGADAAVYGALLSVCES